MDVNECIVKYKEESDFALKKKYQEDIYLQYERMFDLLAHKYSFLAEFDDLKQECYFAMVKALDKYDFQSGASFMTYLYKGVANHILNYCRTNGSLFDLEKLVSLNCANSDDSETELLDLVQSDIDLEEEVLNKCFHEEVLKIINGLLSELDIQSSEIVRLHYIKGLTLEEVADKMGIEYSHIKSICYCSIDKLKRLARKKKDAMDGYFAKAMSQAYKSSYGSFCRTGESSTEKAALKILSVNDYLHQNKYI